MAFLYMFECPECGYHKELIFGVMVTDGGRIYKSLLCPSNHEFVVLHDRDNNCPSCGENDCVEIDWVEVEMEFLPATEYAARMKDIEEDISFRESHLHKLKEQLRDVNIKIAEMEAEGRITEVLPELQQKLLNDINREEDYLKEDEGDRILLNQSSCESGYRKVKMPYCPKCEEKIIMKRLNRRAVD